MERWGASDVRRRNFPRVGESRERRPVASEERKSCDESGYMRREGEGWGGGRFGRFPYEV